MKRISNHKPADLKAGQGRPVTVFVLLAILFLGVVDVSWANPKNNLKANSPIIWNFDTEKAGTLPPDFLVGTLVDGRSAGKWQVIDMQTSLSLLDSLDRADHARISEVLQRNEAPSVGSA
jgi:hypothetical protein